uniref:Uncharacterized protein n=1 Tax=Callorhinchus milii TaxID=7868 RepID=A0A4W3GGQ8_CALMI
STLRRRSDKIRRYIKCKDYYRWVSVSGLSPRYRLLHVFLQFLRSCYVPNTTYRTSYKRYPKYEANFNQLAPYRIRNEGIPHEILFKHNNIPSSWYLVTHYDENFNQRPNPCVPPLRKLKKIDQGWVPERLDFPLAVPPTNFGLLQEKKVKWQIKEPPIYNSVYTLSYGPQPHFALQSSAFARRRIQQPIRDRMRQFCASLARPGMPECEEHQGRDCCAQGCFLPPSHNLEQQENRPIRDSPICQQSVPEIPFTNKPIKKYFLVSVLKLSLIPRPRAFIPDRCPHPLTMCPHS